MIRLLLWRGRAAYSLTRSSRNIGMGADAKGNWTREREIVLDLGSRKHCGRATTAEQRGRPCRVQKGFVVHKTPEYGGPAVANWKSRQRSLVCDAGRQCRYEFPPLARSYIVAIKRRWGCLNKNQSFSSNSPGRGSFSECCADEFWTVANRFRSSGELQVT